MTGIPGGEVVSVGTDTTDPDRRNVRQIDLTEVDLETLALEDIILDTTTESLL